MAISQAAIFIATPATNNAFCFVEVCGNGVVDPGEGCDDGNSSNSDSCLASCASAICGDGFVRINTEQCDDGNNLNGDGCSGCTIEVGFECESLPNFPSECAPVCGDGVVSVGEECDEGNLNSDTTPGACRLDCLLPRCGDGVIDPTEDCDDNNTISDDGCDADCTSGCGNGFLTAGEICFEEVNIDVSGSGEIEVGFFNSDLVPDLAFARSDGSVRVLFNNDGGRSFFETDIAVPAALQFLASGDADGDGDTDLVTTSSALDRAVLLTNGGAGVFSQTNLAMGDGTLGVVMADFDGVLGVDIATANNLADNVTVRLNTGNGTFGSPIASGAIADAPVFIKAGDIDGDGDVDLVTAHLSIDTVSILVNNGAGAFQLQSILPVGDEPRGIALGDIDGDADLDLLVGNTGTNTVSVFTNNGTGNFSLQSNVTTGSGPISLDTGDVDLDGDLDIVSANVIANEIVLFLNNGGGQFSPVSFPANEPRAIRLGDLNGDTIPDISTANTSLQSITVLLSTP